MYPPTCSHTHMTHTQSEWAHAIPHQHVSPNTRFDRTVPGRSPQHC